MSHILIAVLLVTGDLLWFPLPEEVVTIAQCEAVKVNVLGNLAMNGESAQWGVCFARV